MSSEIPPQEEGESPELPGRSEEPWNTAALALHTVVLRIGWIFKTESVIIPAFVDWIAGPAWMRGMLPVLNRVGQAVPSFLLSRRLKITPLKKRTLALTSLGIALPFLLLAWMTHGLADKPPLWVPVVFVLLYVVFFAFAGLGQIVMGTLQGKLIRPDRRGRLLAIATFGAMPPSVVMAWWLLPDWLEAQPPRYDLVFLFTAVCFALSACVALGIREPRDHYQERALGIGDQLRGAWQILRENRDYRRLVIVGTLFSSSIMIFPHYQALARERLDLVGANLMVWVVVQNVSMGLASLVMGPVADRFGNRLTLRLLVFAAAVIPLFAIGLTHLPPELGRKLFPLVFVGIGLVPIGFRVLTNYVLELSPPTEHPRYLSLSQLCTAAAFLASPLFGLLIDWTSFDLVFALESCLMGIGGLLTFRLREPRRLRAR